MTDNSVPGRAVEREPGLGQGDHIHSSSRGSVGQSSPTSEDYDTLPSQMRNARRWLLWKFEPAGPGKKPRKVPYYVIGHRRQGELDSPADIANLAAFEDAFNELATGRYTGLGFALGPDGTGNCWQGIDLDDIPTRPGLALLADDLPGYTEASPSGGGAHAIGYGRSFNSLGSNKSGIEAYAGRRFFTVTADRAGIHPPACLADFVDGRLRPLHGTTGDAPSSVVEEQLRESVQPETIVDLRSALAHMRSDDRDLWVRLGHALKTLGDVGRGLWLEWSQTSDAYNPSEDARTWDSFKPVMTDHRAVFTAAQIRGWINPRSRVAQEATAVTGGYAAPSRAFGFVQASELLSQPKPIRWLIRDVLEQGSLGQLFGDSGSGKSFMAIDWGCSVATGAAWHGKSVEQGAVFYIAGEGHAGIGRRLKAWDLHNAGSLTNAPFFVSTVPASLMDTDNAANVAKAVEALANKHGAPRFIIVDTLARNLGNGEENSNKDISLLINNLDVQLRWQFGATVLIVHHTGHIEKNRSRGASALKAAMDQEYLLTFHDDIRTLKCTKAKESEPPESMTFKLEQVMLDGWTDDNGQPMNSAVLTACTDRGTGKGPRLTGANRIALEALRDALAEDGQPSNADLVKEFGQLRAPSSVVLEAVWRQRCYDMGISEGEQDAKQKAFKRSRQNLLDMGQVSVWKGNYWTGNALAGQRTTSGQSQVLSPTEPDRTGHTPKGVSAVRVGTAVEGLARADAEAVVPV